MMYVDTSIIVAALDPQDPRREEAMSILERSEVKVVSELVLIELSSVLSRRGELVRAMAERLRVSEELTILAMLTYILKRFGLKYVAMEGYLTMPSIGRVSKPFATAVEISSKLGLRALGLLHIAYVKLLKSMGEPIEVFVTADRNFIKAKRFLEDELNVSLRLIT
ncbi:MAG: PIN domain nuclease [Thermoprotei archaeon]|nr:MAG: PIN domain nuclease [Thermoprotei archaeon]